MIRQRLPALAAFVLFAASLPAGDGLAVLFIGNSYIFVNELPQVFTRVVAGGGRPAPTVVSHTAGGQTLGGFCTDAALATKLAAHYDVVILQEQSLVPAIAAVDPQLRQGFLYASVRLAERIRTANPGVRIVFFQTWARASWTWRTAEADLRAGSSADEMQDRLTREYAEAARLCGATVAPVGEAWRTHLRGRHPLPLHGTDGSHPAWAGTYLAALVLAKTIYDPALETKFTGSLSVEQATRLAADATTAVQATQTGDPANPNRP
jgi:hypothetical protein